MGVGQSISEWEWDKALVNGSGNFIFTCCSQPRIFSTLTLLCPQLYICCSCTKPLAHTAPAPIVLMIMCHSGSAQIDVAAIAATALPYCSRNHHPLK